MKNAILSTPNNKFRFLFPNFLEDRRTYAFNQSYWKKLVAPFVKSAKPSESVYNDTFANGQKMYDGNPIFSTRLAPDKLLRIIQEEPESNHPEITAYLEQKDKATELVIVLELSNVTKKIAADLIAEWAKPAVSREKMEGFILTCL